MYLFKKNVITDIIESVDDWLIFGTVQFGRTTSYKFSIDIFSVNVPAAIRTVSPLAAIFTAY